MMRRLLRRLRRPENKVSPTFTPLFEARAKPEDGDLQPETPIVQDLTIEDIENEQHTDPQQQEDDDDDDDEYEDVLQWITGDKCFTIFCFCFYMHFYMRKLRYRRRLKKKRN